MTPRRHRSAAQNPSPRRPMTLAPHPPKTHPTLPGFVNAFVIPPPKKDKGKARASPLETSEGTRERDWDLISLSPTSSPTRAPLHPKVDECMEIDKDETGGQDVTTYPEVDLRMELANNGRTLGPIAGSSRPAKPFNWLGWVCSHLLCLPLMAHILVIDKTTCTRSRNFAQCPDYNAASIRSADSRRPYERFLLGLYVLDGRCSRKFGWVGWVRSCCTRRRQFTSADSGFPISQCPGQLRPFFPYANAERGPS
jgi:hypothetical protein